VGREGSDGVSTLDLSPILTPLTQIAGIAITGLLAIYIPKALAAFQARTGIQLTDQQRATVLGAVQTAAGNLETKLDQGVIKVAQINVNNPAIQAQAQAAINAVPDAMKALNMTPDSVARMIVGKADTGSHGPQPTPVVVAPGTVVTANAPPAPLYQVVTTTPQFVPPVGMSAVSTANKPDTTP
jgi:hypothetical protein